MGEAVEIFHSNGFSDIRDDHHLKLDENQNKCCWYEEEIDEDLKWSFALNSILHRGTSEYQDIALLDTKHFGKVLVIDGKMQSAEMDEFIYHECLIHPALLIHPSPRTVFIMGGGEGSAAREALKHKTIEKVVMCDIDQEVVDFCRRYLTANQEAFCDKKLHLVINDAKLELEGRDEKFDFIVGDLADPVEGGPCYQLYTKSFYERVLKPKLNHNGIFVTQAGPAGVFTHKEVFSSIYNTLKQVFKCESSHSIHKLLCACIHSSCAIFCRYMGMGYAYTNLYMFIYIRMCVCIQASDQPLTLDVKQIDSRIEERITGELLYLNGASLLSSTTMNKSVYASLLNETHVYTEEDARFIHGHGVAYRG
ncbi:hypothetical protein HHK36_021798 [Tetracentron sinense]|uniref:thermospermine synthase n=1 Tax=Tetracentron sinense TaxID=13715 RepID=A0A834YQF4_TETSI|nr:hypothetical protein HHK36_021798 [Tetracentron sinense]